MRMKVVLRPYKRWDKRSLKVMALTTKSEVKGRVDLSQNRASRQIDALLLRVLITAKYPRVMCNAESVAGAYTVGDQADEWTKVCGARGRPPGRGMSTFPDNRGGCHKNPNNSDLCCTCWWAISYSSFVWACRCLFGMFILLNIDETLAGHVQQGQYLVEWVDSLAPITEVGISVPRA